MRQLIQLLKDLTIKLITKMSLKLIGSFYFYIQILILKTNIIFSLIVFSSYQPLFSAAFVFPSFIDFSIASIEA